MAKKDKEQEVLSAELKNVALEGEEKVSRREQIESEADSLSIEDIKSKSLTQIPGDFDWDNTNKTGFFSLIMLMMCS